MCPFAYRYATTDRFLFIQVCPSLGTHCWHSLTHPCSGDACKIDGPSSAARRIGKRTMPPRLTSASMSDGIALTFDLTAVVPFERLVNNPPQSTLREGQQWRKGWWRKEVLRFAMRTMYDGVSSTTCLGLQSDIQTIHKREREPCHDNAIHFSVGHGKKCRYTDRMPYVHAKRGQTDARIHRQHTHLTHSDKHHVRRCYSTRAAAVQTERRAAPSAVRCRDVCAALRQSGRSSASLSLPLFAVRRVSLFRYYKGGVNATQIDKALLWCSAVHQPKPQKDQRQSGKPTSIHRTMHGHTSHGIALGRHDIHHAGYT